MAKRFNHWTVTTKQVSRRDALYSDVESGSITNGEPDATDPSLEA
jgi:hypothetical protein